MTQEKYWTFIDVSIYDADFESRDEAYNHADEQFAQQCVDDDIRDTAQKEILLIEFYYDHKGVRAILKKEVTSLEYEYHQGDFAEHNTLHNAV